MNDSLDLDFLSKQFPGIILWKKDINSNYTDGNLECAKMFGLRKRTDMIGINDYQIPCKLSEFAEVFQKYDKKILLKRKTLKLFEVMQCSKEEWRVFLVTRTPLFNKKQVIIGTFTYSIDITYPFTQINFLINDKFFYHKFSQKSYIIDDKYNDFNLSKRQSECLFFLIRGKTIKEIAKVLNLSPRTVEIHLDKIKQKLQCQTKSQIISDAIDIGLINVIPTSLLKNKISLILKI